MAFEMAIVALQHADRVVSPVMRVAQKIIELAKAGERDPERLRDGLLKAMQSMVPVLISDPSPLPSLSSHDTELSPAPPAGLFVRLWSAIRHRNQRIGSTNPIDTRAPGIDFRREARTRERHRHCSGG
jgi:hypothetical protein